MAKPGSPYFFQSGSGGGSGALIAPTKQIFTSTGTTTGQIFTCSSANATVGATYKDNNGAGNTFTVLATIAGSTTLYCSGSGTSPISPLAKQTGTGDASIIFSASQALATYSLPANCLAIKIMVIGGGGGGGGVASAASSAAAAGGGGGGGGSIKWIISPSSTYFYAVGTGGSGGVAGANPGSSGLQSLFNALSPVIGGGGGGGGGSGTSSTAQFVSAPGTGGTASGGDINSPGGGGLGGTTLSASQASPGTGGSSILAGGAGNPLVNQSSAGTAGTLYGGGGTGASQINNGGTKAGGNGAAGVVIVEEFYA